MTSSTADIRNASDVVGYQTLQHIEKMRRFNRWMSATVRPYIDGHVLEIGCGIGNLTEFILAAGCSVVGLDLRPEYIQCCRQRLGDTEDFEGYTGDIAGDLPDGVRSRQFDTVVMLNVLEHIADEARALQNVARLCRPGGRFVCLVPAHRWLYGSLDAHLGHYRRYDRESLEAVVRGAGLRPERCFHFNVAGIPGWWLSGRILRRRTLTGTQLALFDRLVPLFRLCESMAAGRAGQSLVIVARNDADGQAVREDA